MHVVSLRRTLWRGRTNMNWGIPQSPPRCAEGRGSTARMADREPAWGPRADRHQRSPRPGEGSGGAQWRRCASGGQAAACADRPRSFERRTGDLRRGVTRAFHRGSIRPDDRRRVGAASRLRPCPRSARRASARSSRRGSGRRRWLDAVVTGEAIEDFAPDRRPVEDGGDVRRRAKRLDRVGPGDGNRPVRRFRRRGCGGRARRPPRGRGRRRG